MNYFAIEGIDNSGKSTIIKKLKKEFQDFNYVREPGTTKFAEEMRNVMFSNIDANPLAIQVAMTSARIDLANSILSQEKDTISDRCYLSLAYTENFEEDICDKLIRTNIDLVPLLPNIIIYLKVSAEESVKRFGRKKMEGYDTLSIESINKKLARYERMISKVRELNLAKVFVVDSSRELDLVYNDVRNIIYDKQGQTNRTC